MNFDPIQEKEIKKTMELLVKDMRSLYQIYPYENIEVGISMIVGDYGDFWNLIITGESINLYSNKHNNVTNNPLISGAYLFLAVAMLDHLYISTSSFNCFFS